MKKTMAMFLMLATLAVAQYSMFDTGPTGIDPVQGAWVEYDMKTNDNEDFEVRYAIVGEEDCAEGECYWFEYRMKDKNSGEKTITKILTHGDPTKESQRMRMIMQSNDDQPVELVFEIPPEDAETAKAKDAEPEVEETADYSDIDDMYDIEGTEKITVPAGTFECRKFVINDENEVETATYWISSDVSFIGIVKSIGKDSGEMLLTSYSNEGAETEITGTPEVVKVPSSSEDYLKMLGESAKEGAKEGVKEGVKEGAKESAKEAAKSGIKSLIGF
ncbi:MAG: hypothetical protein ACLFSQ_05575 [Candidatus Zixiibacteriota bacterium]